jgi:NAD(P)-dependent dehydrogenase (short-subunit alcohol dehydrogenase family)
VVATDLDFKALKKCASEDWPRPGAGARLELRPLDVREASDWESAVRACESALGGLDAMVNFAGYLRPAAADAATEDEVDMHIDVNVRGCVHGTRAAAKLMAAQVREGRLPHGGHVINVASLGALAPATGYALYIGTKYAVRGFSLCAAKDLEPHGVYVSVLLPDAAQTPMLTLQKDYDASAIAFSGQPLSAEAVADAVVADLLQHRQRELCLSTSWLRRHGARFGDLFSDCRAVSWIEASMRAKGRRRQRELNGAAAAKAS